MKPLAGTTIIEALSADCPLALRLSVGFAGRLAADLGATVVKLEPPDGDPVRRLPPLDENGRSTLFAFLNAGKRSVLDASATGRLVGSADAVLRDRGRRVPDGPIDVELSMIGARDAGSQTEFTILALGGMLDIVGDPARQPLRLGGHQLAYAAGLAAYTGLVASLLRRPERETVRVSLLEVAVWINWKSVASVAAMGKLSTRAGRAAEWSVVKCKDGYLALVHQAQDWGGLRRLCDDPRLDDPLFADPPNRAKNAAALADVVEAALAPMTRAELQTRAMALRLPLGAVWEIGDLLEDAQVTARGFLALAEADGAPIRMPRLPVLWNGQAFPPGAVPGRAEAVA
ncbi:MAG TPA: CoA transferase [Rhodopila sp.]|uniref:CoA transferase n=1 Tax=Rhodopila sp. TaxID=2480087 RepID=UPI002C46576D|nr:CoA transferase [Rhodopila sp.]HVY16957.1 CoA transferase [Rhodopila sp.]